MAVFRVQFASGKEKQFTVSKTTAEVNVIVKDAKTAGEFIKVGELLMNPDTITEIEKIEG